MSLATDQIVSEAIETMNPDEQAFMAGLVLAGWVIKLKNWTAAPRQWCATPPLHDEPKFYAPTLFALLGYIERRHPQ